MDSRSTVTGAAFTAESGLRASRPVWPLDLAYVLFTALLFQEVLLGGARLVDRDLLQYLYPLGRAIGDAFAGQGSLLWDTGVDHGMPLAARWSPAVYYPAHWLFALLREDLALAIAVLVHFPVAASSMLRLALRYTTSMPAAWIGGLGFAFSGYLLSMVGGGTYLYGAALLPLSLLAVHRLAESPTLGRVLQLAAVFSLQIFNPDPQTLYYEVIVCGPFLLWLRVPRGRRLHALGAAAAAGGLAVAVGWCQLWPAAEVAGLSVRAAGLSLAEATLWSLHPARLVELVVPGLFGGFYPDGTYWGCWLSNGVAARPWATSLHVGLVLLVGLVALRRTDRRAAWAWAGLALLFLLLAMGRWTPLYQALHWLPGAGSFRYPEKHLLFVTLGVTLVGAMGLGRLLGQLAGGEVQRVVQRALVAVCVAAGLLAAVRLLAGIGREQLERLVVSRESAVDAAAAASATIAALDRALVVAVALLVLLALRGRLRARLVTALLLGVAALDLLLAGLPLRVLGGGGWLSGELPLCQALPVEASGLKPLIWRNPRMAYHGDPPGVRGPVSPAERHRRWERFTGKPNVATRCARYALGYDAASMLTHEQLARALASDPDRLADVMGVRYLIDSPGTLSGYPVRAQLPDWTAAVYENEDALAYATAFGHMVRVRNAVQAAVQVADPTFDFRRQIVLEGARGPSSFPDAVRSAVVRRHRPGLIEVAIDFGEPGFLLLLESHYPGWKAWIDGRAVPILRANAAFIGLAVDRGQHDLRLEFVPDRQRLANRVSVVALIGFLGFAGIALWRHGSRR